MAYHLRLKTWESSSLSRVNRRGGEGIGFSSEIETLSRAPLPQHPCQVARELASHLRLKQKPTAFSKVYINRGEGTGFSSEIETHRSASLSCVSPCGEGTGFSSE